MKKIILIIVFILLSAQIFSDDDLILNKIEQLDNMKGKIREAIGLLHLVSEGQIVIRQQIRKFSREDRIEMIDDYNTAIDSLIALQDSFPLENLKIEINE